MGSPDFAVSILDALVFKKHEIIAVYTQPPRQKGRGQGVQKSPVHQKADLYGIPTYTPENFKTAESKQQFSNLGADIALVAAYGVLLPKEVLDAPKFGCINVHASLLPRWRGAAPIQRAIESGDNQTGITMMQMDQGLDTGAILLQREMAITKETNAQLLHDELCSIGAVLAHECLVKIAQGGIVAQPQPIDGYTYAPKVKKEELIIDWYMDVDALERKIRAFSPAPGMRFKHRKEIFKVLKAQIISHEVHATPGSVLNDQLHIACKNGVIQPTLIQREGKNTMEINEFLKGFKIGFGVTL